MSRHLYYLGVKDWPTPYAPRDQQPAMREDVDWIQQPAFDKVFADLTGTQCEHEEWRRETKWNFTADDASFM